MLSSVPEHDEFLESFGSSIKSLRASHGISQEQLAERANLDRTYISDVERGRRNLGLRNIVTLAKSLAVEPADLFPRTSRAPSSTGYLANPSFALDCGFVVTALSVRNSVMRTNRVMEALPLSLFRIVDFKAQSGMVGAVFASELASEFGAIPNPIEKGHPDIVPIAAASARESELRNYPQGLEIKSTVGTITQGVKRMPGHARIDNLTSITWQAHHRDVKQLMGITWDYVGGSAEQSTPPSVTGVFFAGDLIEDDWGAIAGTTGRNTKVTGMKTSGRTKMAAGAIVLLNEERYLRAFRSRIGQLPQAFEG